MLYYFRIIQRVGNIIPPADASAVDKKNAPSRRVKNVSQEFPAAEKEAGDDDNDEESPAHEGEDLNEFSSASGVFPHVDAVVYDRRKRADDRAEPGCVGSVDESGEVL